MPGSNGANAVKRLLIVPAALAALAMASPASAHDPWDRGRWHEREHWHEHHGPGPGVWLGLGAAAIAGGLLAAPYLPGPVPYAPAPPPVYAPYPPAYVPYAPPPPPCWFDAWGRRLCRSF